MLETFSKKSKKKEKLKNSIGSKEILAIAGFFLCTAIFAIILFYSSLSVGSLVNIQNYFISGVMTDTAGMTTLDAVISLINPFITAIIALIFLVAGFAFLSAYGFVKSYSRLGLVSVAVAPLFLILFNFSLLSFFLSIAVVISSITIIPLSNTYGKELKRWTFFRTGSHSIGRVLLMTNILITIAVFLTIFTSLGSYEQSFKEDLSDTVTAMLSSSFSGELLPELQDEVNQRITTMFDESPIIGAYIRWLPVLTALLIFFILEFFRSLILSNIGGFFTDILIRINNKMTK
jgi:hypothetical protein